MSNVELVGILNITPDSFSGDGVIDPEDALKRAGCLMEEGAGYIDVGAQSTRPGAVVLNHRQEWARLAPILPELNTRFSSQVSLDTFHPLVVKRAAREIGPLIINDVTGFNNPEMIDTVASLRLPCIVSHLPESYGLDIQSAHADKPIDSIHQVQDELLSKRAKMINAGIHKDMITLDPGIGFGKTPETNWDLLSFAALVPDTNVMIGYSRKRFLGERRMEIEPNLEAGRIAVAAGARFLRVHDVAGHAELRK